MPLPPQTGQWRRNGLAGGIALMFLSLPGCSGGQRVEQCSDKVDTFHSSFNNNDYVAMYGAFSKKFRDANEFDDFVARISQMRTQIGKHESSLKAKWDTGSIKVGKPIRLSFISMFGRYKLEEVFVCEPVATTDFDSFSIVIISRRKNF